MEATAVKSTSFSFAAEATAADTTDMLRERFAMRERFGLTRLVHRASRHRLGRILERLARYHRRARFLRA